MAYIYVKSGGTATGTAGKYTDAKTGSWSTAFTDPSQYYGSIELCVDNASLAIGDIIVVSNLHNYSSPSLDVSFSLPSGSRVVSVDDTDITSLLSGAVETVSTYTISCSNGYIYGISFVCWEFTCISSVTWEECTFKYSFLIGIENSSSQVYPTVFYRTCTFNTIGFEIWGGNINFIDCNFILDLAYNSPATFIFDMQDFTWGNEWGADLTVTGCDFYNDPRRISNGSGSYDGALIHYSSSFNRCKSSDSTRRIVSLFHVSDTIYFNSNPPFPNGSIINFTSLSGGGGLSTGVNYYVINSSGNTCQLSLTLNGAPKLFSSDGTGIFQKSIDLFKLEISDTRSPSLLYPTAFYYEESKNVYYYSELFRYGSVITDLTIYRDKGATLNNVTPYSVLLKTASSLYKSTFVKFKVAEFIADFTELSEFKIEVSQPNSSLTLKKSDVWIELAYPDANNSKFNLVSSKENLLSGTSGTAYPFSNEVWQGTSGPVCQYISVNTTEIGKEGFCTVWVYCTLASAIINVCPKYKLTRIS